MLRRAVVVLVLVAVLVTPRTARAGGLDDLGDVFKVLIYGVFVTIGVDAYEAGVDVSGAARHVAPSGPRAGFELVWGGWQTVFIVGVGTVGLARGDTNTGGGLLAFSTFPLALAMHGAWGVRSDAYAGFPLAVLPVAALDGVVLGIDAIRLAGCDDGDAVGLEVGEALGALPQLVFGIAQAAGGRRTDVGPTLALSALPLAMLVHSSYLTFASATRSATPEAKRSARASWSLAPLPVDGPGAFALGIAGRF